MNGRIYDPEIGRFLSADPFVQYPTSTQGFNRYTYVNNNPLSYSDPSGYFSLSKSLKKFGGLAASIAGGAMCINAGPACAVLAGAGSGAIGGFLSTGSLKGAFNGAVIGFAAAGMSYQIGEAFSGVTGSTMALTKGVSHGVTQGAFGMLRGGRFKDSFSAAFVASLVGPAIENVGNAASRIVMSSMIGGTVSVIGGGKFAPGAISAAFVQAFNEEHSRNLNMTLEEYLEAVENGLWQDAPVLEGLSDDDAVNSAAGEVNSKSSGSSEDVTADQRYSDFVKQAARPTAQARLGNGVVGEKFLALSINVEGVVVVNQIAVLGGQGGDVTALLNGAGAIAHVHYEGLVQRPYGADHSAVKFRNISSFVIGKNGRYAWEIGRINGEYKYRYVGSNGWKDY